MILALSLIAEQEKVYTDYSSGKRKGDLAQGHKSEGSREKSTNRLLFIYRE